MVKDITDYMRQAGYTSTTGGAKVKMADKLIRDGVLNLKEDILFVKKGADTSFRKASRIVLLTESGCRKLEQKLVKDGCMPWDVMPEPEKKLPFDNPIEEAEILPWEEKIVGDVERAETNDAVENALDEMAAENGYLPETPRDKGKFYAMALKTIDDLKQKVAEMEKEVLFAKSVKASNDCINVGMMARILFMNGVDTSERKLFKWLHENGWLDDKDNFKNIPTEKAIEKGYMKFNECAVTTSVGRVHLSFTPKITGEGQEYFTNVFLGDCHD